jgi:hypothetical protein
MCQTNDVTDSAPTACGRSFSFFHHCCTDCFCFTRRYFDERLISHITIPYSAPLIHGRKLSSSNTYSDRSLLAMCSPSVSYTANLSPTQISILPTNKHDHFAIEHISTLPDSEIAPLLPEILTWVQDTNWPISRTVSTFLLQHPTRIVEPVRHILQSDDAEWIYNVLGIIEQLPKEVQKALKVEVERVALRPTEEEKDFEAQDVAQGIIYNFKNTKDKSWTSKS